MSQSETAERVLEAHVAFELSQWRGEHGADRLQGLVDAFWAWAETTTLDAVVDDDTLRAAAERLVLDIDLPDQLAAVIGAIADDLIRLPVNQQTRVRDVVDQSLFESGVSLTIELESLRARLIQQLLNSPVYTALASDVLYQGIKDYIFADSGAIRSIPGVSRLIRGSSAAVSRRMPGLEAQVESRVRTYIENNTAKTLARSEAYLLESLDGPRIAALADEIWAAVADKSLSIADTMSSHESQRITDYGLEVWRSLRETEYVATLIDEGVQAYLARHRSDTLADLMRHVGIDRDVLTTEAQHSAAPLLDGLADTGLLEIWIRDQLTPFYRSEAFSDAIDPEGRAS